MSGKKMHADELDIDADLVRRLLLAQFPDWTDLPLSRVASDGTVNAMFRLGEHMVVRLPRMEEWAGSLEHEYRWLPLLAAHLPLAIPVPVAIGAPGEGYPCRWSVYEWLDGETAAMDRLDSLDDAATTIAGFVTALRQIDPAGGPPAKPRDRGGVLARRDDETRNAISKLHGLIDAHRVLDVWDECLDAPPFEAHPVWIHTDLLPSNLLVNGGKLTAVIDWGAACVGDPATDLTIAWSLLTAETRDIYRRSLETDDATWARGRGWALNQALMALPYYQDTNPAFVELAGRMIDEILVG